MTTKPKVTIIFPKELERKCLRIIQRLENENCKISKSEEFPIENKAMVWNCERPDTFDLELVKTKECEYIKYIPEHASSNIFDNAIHLKVDEFVQQLELEPHIKQGIEALKEGGGKIIFPREFKIIFESIIELAREDKLIINDEWGNVVNQIAETFFKSNTEEIMYIDYKIKNTNKNIGGDYISLHLIKECTSNCSTKKEPLCPNCKHNPELSKRLIYMGNEANIKHFSDFLKDLFTYSYPYLIDKLL